MKKRDDGEPTRGGNVYHAQNESMKPIHEKKNTRPCGSTGFKIGTLRAFLLTELSTGRSHKEEAFKPMMAVFLIPKWSLIRLICCCSRGCVCTQGDEKASLTELRSSVRCPRMPKRVMISLERLNPVIYFLERAAFDMSPCFKDLREVHAR